jgi:hypothetical protein
MSRVIAMLNQGRTSELQTECTDQDLDLSIREIA